MASYCAGLWQVGVRDTDNPYVAMSFAAHTKEEAVAKGRNWAHVQDQLPQTRLQIIAKGLTIHREFCGMFVF